MPNTELDLLRGTFDLILLRTLSWGPMHGLGILRWIENTTQNSLQIEEGSLYPALHRLEQKGWLEAEWGMSENNRRAKYYRLSKSGRTQLSAELGRWNRYTKAVGQIIAANGAA
ncbi:MAG: PadR family transcriptional regulator [Gemmatimonadaceae bacterium]